MQSLQNNYGVILQLEFIALELAFAGLEVEGWQFNLLALQQVSHLLTEVREV